MCGDGTYGPRPSGTCFVELSGYFFSKSCNNSKPVVFEDLLFRKSSFSKRDIFDLLSLTLDSVVHSTGMSEFFLASIFSTSRVLTSRKNLSSVALQASFQNFLKNMPQISHFAVEKQLKIRNSLLTKFALTRFKNELETSELNRCSGFF